jgi:hypothetical protein
MLNATMFSRIRSIQRHAIGVAAVSLAALALGPIALAQTDPDPSALRAGDPPARVGRISLIAGPVTLVDYRANEESDATLNWPLTSQQRLSTGRQGRVEVRIGSTSIRLDGDTVIDFNRIDDELVQMTLQRGTAAVRVRNRDQLRELDLLTPRERITFEDVGRYRIDFDRPPGITAVTSNVGSARVLNGRTNFIVQSGQRGEATAEPLAGFQVVTPAPDVFDDWVAARDRRDDSLQSTRYVSAETTGVESLDDDGDWRTVESYGAVWFPTGIAAGWAPYRYGHWAYVRPWGWTWIDDASWGFTPFHYGRWVYVQNTWGWVPGAYVARPCYAPALVAWYGTPGVSVGVGFGSVGWFPLAPNEVFIPSYRYSRRYITQVNYGPVTNVTNITVINPPPNYRYRQPNYSTWAPSDAIVRRTPINRVVQAPPSDWAKIPVQPHPPVRVTEDFRRTKQNVISAPASDGSRTFVPPQRAIAPRPNEPARGESPARTPQGREIPTERAGERDGRRQDFVTRPPATKPVPNDERMPAPRAVAPRPDLPRQEAPRRELPRAEPPVAAPAPMVRPPKTIERAPIERAPAPTGQVGGPAQQIAPRPAPPQRAEPPAQVVAPRPAPVPRQEAPVHQVPPVQRGGEPAQHAKPVQRPAEQQRN